MGEKLFTHPSLKGDYYVPDDITPEEEKEQLAVYQKFERQEQINAKQVRESKRQFNAQIDQAASMNQPRSAINEGLASGSSMGLSDAVAALSGVPLNAPTSPRMTNPYAFAGSEILGSLVTPGGAAKGVKTIGQGILRGAGLGGLMGGIGSGANAIVEGERDPLEVGKAIIPGAILGGGIGAAIPAGGALIGKYGPRLLEAGKNLLGKGKTAQVAAQNAQVLGNTGGNVTINQGVQQAGKIMSRGEVEDMARQHIERVYSNVPETRLLASSIMPIGKTGREFKNITASVVPDVLNEFEPGSGFEGLNKAVKTAKRDLWDQVEEHVTRLEGQGQKYDGDFLADSILKSLDNKKLQRESKNSPKLQKMIEDIKAKAESYRENFGFREGEEILQTTNAELAQLYQKLGISEKVAKTNYETMADWHLADAIRKEQERILKDMPHLKRRWGNLEAFDEAMERYRPQYERQRIEGLEKLTIAQQFGKAIGSGTPVQSTLGIAASKLLNEADKPDAKINRAMAGFLKKRPVQPNRPSSP